MIFGQDRVEEGEEALETAVATLLLITAAVVLACVVVSYAVSTVEQILTQTTSHNLLH